MNWFSVLILFGAFQGLILSLVTGKSKKGNIKANRLLSIYILIIALTLIGRFFFTLQPFTLLDAKILFFGDFIIFLLGPMFYFYLLALFDLKPRLKIPVAVHFIPLIIFIIIISPFLPADRERFLQLSLSYEKTFIWIEIFALLQNLFYVGLNLHVLKRYNEQCEIQNSASPRTGFYKILLGITITGLFFWGVSLVIKLIDPEVAGNYIGYHFVWISLSCSIIALGYYALSNPEALLNGALQKKYESKPAGLDNIDELNKKLAKVMKEIKPFLNPKLTLSELSEISGINSHLLSRIINEKHNQNFFEYVNSHRIEEFKQIVKNEEKKSLTLLAMAYEAGFNSKTTFNTAFKKITNLTPREYLRLAADN